jgi:hypothetical protein
VASLPAEGQSDGAYPVHSAIRLRHGFRLRREAMPPGKNSISTAIFIVIDNKKGGIL